MRFSSLRTCGKLLGALRPAVAAVLLVPFAVVAPEQPAAAQDRTLTVAVDGSDSGPCTATASLRTIQRAVDLAGPGTVIQIRGGTCGPSVDIRIEKSGTPSQPITVRAYNGEHVDYETGPHLVLDSSGPGRAVPR